MINCKMILGAYATSLEVHTPFVNEPFFVQYVRYNPDEHEQSKLEVIVSSALQVLEPATLHLLVPGNVADIADRRDIWDTGIEHPLPRVLTGDNLPPFVPKIVEISEDYIRINSRYISLTPVKIGDVTKIPNEENALFTHVEIELHQGGEPTPYETPFQLFTYGYTTDHHIFKFPWGDIISIPSWMGRDLLAEMIKALEEKGQISMELSSKSLDYLHRKVGMRVGHFPKPLLHEVEAMSLPRVFVFDGDSQNRFYFLSPGDIDIRVQNERPIFYVNLAGFKPTRPFYGAHISVDKRMA